MWGGTTKNSPSVNNLHLSSFKFGGFLASSTIGVYQVIPRHSGCGAAVVVKNDMN
ncbi:MAG: hypothetical protein GY801_31775 [bacterium]|nr:hypothetical protein [bacterium]